MWAGKYADSATFEKCGLLQAPPLGPGFPVEVVIHYRSQIAKALPALTLIRCLGEVTPSGTWQLRRPYSSV